MSAALHTSVAIRATGLRRSFRQITAVGGVDLDIPAGAVFGLLGPDGAGKSTLIRMLATVLRVDSGDALIFGESVVSAPSAVTPRIGYMSQRFSMYPDLTVAENLTFFATLRSVPAAVRRGRTSSLLASMGLSEFAHRQARYLSGGMKQKLMLAATLLHEPDLLLLDEPTTGVDPVSRREFWRIIAALHRQGKTVFVATPYMDEAERCTEVAFMEGGRLRYGGTPAELKALVPGTLYEVVAGDPRDALAKLEVADGISSAHLFGEVVRVLVAPDGPTADGLANDLTGDGIEVTEVREARIDMEAVFVYLAEDQGAEQEAGQTASGSAT